jgi:hypothetical protein
VKFFYGYADALQFFNEERHLDTIEHRVAIWIDEAPAAKGHVAISRQQLVE